MSDDTKKDVVPSQYRDRYKSTGGTCGDFIATKLQSIAKEGTGGLDAVKAENGIEKDRWSGFNPGMQRMNLANVLRGRFLKGETITILGKQYNAKHLAEEANFTVEDKPAVLQRLAKYLEVQDNERTVAALQKLFFAPPKKAGKTAEERAADKAAKDAEKQRAKDLKAAKSAVEKAKKARAKTLEAAKKADKVVEEAKAALAAVKDDEVKVKKANEVIGKAEDKAAAARAKDETANKAVEDAHAKVKELEAPAEATA